MSADSSATSGAGELSASASSGLSSAFSSAEGSACSAVSMVSSAAFSVEGGSSEAVSVDAGSPALSVEDVDSSGFTPSASLSLWGSDSCAPSSPLGSAEAASASLFSSSVGPSASATVSFASLDDASSVSFVSEAASVASSISAGSDFSLASFSSASLTRHRRGLLRYYELSAAGRIRSAISTPGGGGGGGGATIVSSFASFSGADGGGKSIAGLPGEKHLASGLHSGIHGPAQAVKNLVPVHPGPSLHRKTTRDQLLNSQPRQALVHYPQKGCCLVRHFLHRQQRVQYHHRLAHEMQRNNIVRRLFNRCRFRISRVRSKAYVLVGGLGCQGICRRGWSVHCGWIIAFTSITYFHGHFGFLDRRLFCTIFELWRLLLFGVRLRLRCRAWLFFRFRINLHLACRHHPILLRKSGSLLEQRLPRKIRDQQHPEPQSPHCQVVQELQEEAVKELEAVDFPLQDRLPQPHARYLSFSSCPSLASTPPRSPQSRLRGELQTPWLLCRPRSPRPLSQSPAKGSPVHILREKARQEVLVGRVLGVHRRCLRDVSDLTHLIRHDIHTFYFRCSSLLFSFPNFTFWSLIFTGGFVICRLRCLRLSIADLVVDDAGPPRAGRTLLRGSFHVATEMCLKLYRFLSSSRWAADMAMMIVFREQYVSQCKKGNKGMLEMM
ncbi:hypothetical protein KC362_g95 [Hortaea werneckii]|nr:hypothetical protein KC362_g95 [Hortaea werneckii]